MWGKCGCAGGVTGSAAGIVCCYREILVFDRYTEISAKDHERQKRAGVVSTTFNLDLDSYFLSREAVMKNKHNKRGMSRSTCGVGCQWRAGIMTSSCTMKLTSPSSAICFKPPMLVGGQNSQRRQRHFRAAGLLDVTLRSTGSCCCEDGKVGLCCP